MTDSHALLAAIPTDIRADARYSDFLGVVARGYEAVCEARSAPTPPLCHPDSVQVHDPAPGVTPAMAAMAYELASTGYDVSSYPITFDIAAFLAWVNEHDMPGAIGALGTPGGHATLAYVDLDVIAHADRRRS